MTTVSYGEQMLARAEARARGAAARRRFVRLFCPAAVATVWAVVDLLVARNGRLLDEGAGVLRQVADVFLPSLWTLLLVLAPLALAVKRRPLPNGAGLALAAGPILTPLLFGPGGWHPWQIAIVATVAVVILVAGNAQRRDDEEG